MTASSELFARLTRLPPLATIIMEAVTLATLQVWSSGPMKHLGTQRFAVGLGRRASECSEAA